MYLPKIRELKEALTSLFTKPYTSGFPAGKFIPAEEYRGKPRFNEEFCVGCGTCSQVCPPGAIDLTDDAAEGKRYLKISYYSCINCGQCEENCITGKGVRLTNEYSFAAFTREDPGMFESLCKDLILCEVCGDIIGSGDHLNWIKDRLGAKAWAHPNFLIEMQREFTEIETQYSKSRIRREDQMLEVCPHCRNKIVVEDEFYINH
jgi:formate hydrogenlyase subunit 6/NADH:ubiquinone oxidoreductase subunit I